MLIKRLRSSFITAVLLWISVSPVVGPCGKTVQIHELNYSDFGSFVENQNYATILYIHHPDCDSCKHFLEPFNIFAAEISDWVSTGLVRLAKLNCEKSEKDRICRWYGMSEYSSFMFFRPNLQLYLLGNLIEVNDSHHLPYYLTNIVVEKAEEYNFNTNKIWPDLRPLKPKTKEELFSLLPDNSNDKIVLFAIEHTHKNIEMLSAKVILDSNQFKDSLVIVSVSRYNGLSKNLDYHVLNEKQQLNFFRLYQLIDKKTHKAKLLINKRGMLLVEEEQQLRSCINKFIRHRYIFQSTIERLNGSQVLNVIEEMLPLLGSNKQGRRALLEFLKVVINVFPFENNGFNQMKIIRIKQKLEISNSTYKTDDGKCVKSNSTRQPVILCSLWSLYYTLVIGDHKTQSMNRLSAFSAIQDIFSLSQFQCEECLTRIRKNKGLRIFQNYQLESFIIWLWKVHNDMNQFIECDGYIAPKKTIETFPSRDQCPECFEENGKWIENKVQDFLISYFWPDDERMSTILTTEAGTTDNIVIHANTDFSAIYTAFEFILVAVALVSALVLCLILFKIL